MKTSKASRVADFEYAEFSGDVFCPFCNSLLFADLSDQDESATDRDDGSALSCDHVGFWSFGRIEEPNLNEKWRNEIFSLARVLKASANHEPEDGLHWQEALNVAIDEEGSVGLAVAAALSDLQVVIYKHFSYFSGYAPDLRTTNYLAILLKKKRNGSGGRQLTSKVG